VGYLVRGIGHAAAPIVLRLRKAGDAESSPGH
jgi:hypothetical protein